MPKSLLKSARGLALEQNLEAKFMMKLVGMVKNIHVFQIMLEELKVE